MSKVTTIAPNEFFFSHNEFLTAAFSKVIVPQQLQQKSQTNQTHPNYII
jgi:hypothetical protein